jgi:hypothetical protein
MKTQITLVTFFLTAIPFFSNGQASVVTDPGSYTYLAEQAAQAGETVAQVKKQVDILQEARDAVQKISNTLRDIIVIDDIINNQTYAVKYAQDSYRRFEQSGNFTPAELAQILISFTAVLTVTANNIKLANAVVKDGFLKMNDAERLKALQGVLSDTRTAANDIILMEWRFNVIQQRKILGKAFGTN